MKKFLVNAISFLWGNGTSQYTAQQALQFTPGTEDVVLTKILEVTCPIGFILMAMYFMIGLLKDGTNEKDTDIHMLIRNGIMLIVSDLLLINAPKIIGTLMSLSNSFMETMRKTTEAAGLEMADLMVNGTAEMTATLNDLSWIALIVLFIVSLISYVMGLFGAAITFVVCASAKIELMIRFSYAPIGLASVAEGGPHAHEAIRYLKKLFASGFQFGAIILALFLANIFGKGFLTHPTVANRDYLSFAIAYFTNAIYSMVLPLAAVGSISAAKQLINEAFGV